MTSSMISPVAGSTMWPTCARFGSPGKAVDWARKIDAAISSDAGPLSRTTPMPPLPGGVEMAAIVSSLNILVLVSGLWFLVACELEPETRNQKLFSGANGNFAILAVTLAFGCNRGVIGQREVNNASFVWSHRIEAEGDS